MSKLSEMDVFVGATLKKVIRGQEWFFEPIGAANMKLIMRATRASTVDEEAQAILDLFYKYVRDNVPDASDDELRKCKFGFINEVVEAALEANGVNVSDRKELLERLKNNVA